MLKRPKPKFLTRSRFFVYPELYIDQIQVNVDAASPLEHFGVVMEAMAIDNHGKWLGSVCRREVAWRPPLEAKMESDLLGLKLVGQVRAFKSIILLDSLQTAMILNDTSIACF